MGEEKRTWSLVADLLMGREPKIPLADYKKRARPLPLGVKGHTANHIFLSFPAQYDLACRGLLPEKEEDSIRDRVLTEGRRQIAPEFGGLLAEPNTKTGLGVIENHIEMWVPSSHAPFHLGPAVAILNSAVKFGDLTVLEVYRHLINSYYGLWHLGVSPDGQVVLPGGRFIAWAKGRTPMPKLDAQGWHHIPTNHTLSQMTDALYRMLSGLPQRDNRGRARGLTWALNNRSMQGHQVVRCLTSLIERGIRIVREEPRLFIPIEPGGSFDSRWHLHLRLNPKDVERERDAFWLTLAAVEVRAKWIAPGRNKVAWKPIIKSK